MQYTSRSGRMTTRAVAQTPLRLPASFATLGAHVMGLANIPPAETFSEVAGALPPGKTPDNLNGTYGPYFPPDLKEAYDFPSAATANGAGVTIAIVIDAQVRTTDVAHFSSVALSHAPLNMTTIPISGGGPPDTGEGTLDVEQSGGIAPGAAIDVYDVPSLTDLNIYNAYEAAYNNANVFVVNSSFGQCETDFNSSQGIAELNDYDAVFQEGTLAGMTWVAASGDWSAFSCSDSSLNKVGVSWPASDPYVLSIGGTDLATTHIAASNQSSYSSETAYDYAVSGGKYWGSGGGYSTMYPRPSYQNGFISNPGRGVPDMALHMGCCPAGGGARSTDASSDWVYLNGQWVELIGTSAASPDMVGLVALRDEILRGGSGDLHPLLYSKAKTAPATALWFRRGIPGNNGYHTSTAYWDAVLGLGTPLAGRLAGSSGPWAGVPGTSSNPGR